MSANNLSENRPDTSVIPLHATIDETRQGVQSSLIDSRETRDPNFIYPERRLFSIEERQEELNSRITLFYDMVQASESNLFSTSPDVQDRRQALKDYISSFGVDWHQALNGKITLNDQRLRAMERDFYIKRLNAEEHDYWDSSSTEFTNAFNIARQRHNSKTQEDIKQIAANDEKKYTEHDQASQTKLALHKKLRRGTHKHHRHQLELPETSSATTEGLVGTPQPDHPKSETKQEQEMRQAQEITKTISEKHEEKRKHQTEAIINVANARAQRAFRKGSAAVEALLSQTNDLEETVQLFLQAKNTLSDTIRQITEITNGIPTDTPRDEVQRMLKEQYPELMSNYNRFMLAALSLKNSLKNSGLLGLADSSPRHNLLRMEYRDAIRTKLNELGWQKLHDEQHVRERELARINNDLEKTRKRENARRFARQRNEETRQREFSQRLEELIPTPPKLDRPGTNLPHLTPEALEMPRQAATLQRLLSNPEDAQRLTSILTTSVIDNPNDPRITLGSGESLSVKDINNIGLSSEDASKLKEIIHKAKLVKNGFFSPDKPKSPEAERKLYNLLITSLEQSDRHLSALNTYLLIKHYRDRNQVVPESTQAAFSGFSANEQRYAMEHSASPSAEAIGRLYGDRLFLHNLRATGLLDRLKPAQPSPRANALSQQDYDDIIELDSILPSPPPVPPAPTTAIPPPPPSPPPTGNNMSANSPRDETATLSRVNTPEQTTPNPEKSIPRNLIPLLATMLNLPALRNLLNDNSVRVAPLTGPILLDRKNPGYVSPQELHRDRSNIRGSQTYTRPYRPAGQEGQRSRTTRRK